MDIQNEKQLITCLAGLSLVDNERRQLCEKALKLFCKNPQCVLAFAKVILTSKLEEVRHMAAVLLRRRIQSLWKHFSAKEYVKTAFLERMVKEQSGVVRTAIIHCVGKIAIFEIENWKELNNLIFQLVRNTSEIHRESGYLLAGVLLENVPARMVRNMDLCVMIFKQGLVEKNGRLRTTTLVSIEHLINAVIKNQNPITVLIPELLKLVHQIINTKNSYMLSLAFTVFDVLAEIRSDSLAPVLPKMVEYMISVAEKKMLDISAREKAVDFIIWVLEFNVEIMIRSNLLPRIMNLGSKMLLEYEEKVHGSSGFFFDEYDEDFVTAFKLGESLVDQICMTTPASMVFNNFVNISMGLLKINNPVHQVGGFSILGTLSNGCGEKTKSFLRKFIPIVKKAFQESPNVGVRAASMKCMLKYSVNCQPDIARFHADVMPVFIRGLYDPHLGVREAVCLVLESYVDSLVGSTLTPYSQQLVKALFPYITMKNIRLQLAALATITAMCDSLGAGFMPFFPTTYNIMKYIVEKNDSSENAVMMKTRAVKSVGVIARRVGIKNFGGRARVIEWMKMVFHGMETIDDYAYREGCFYCIQNFAMVLGSKFTPFLSISVQVALSSIEVTLARKNVTKESFLDEEEEEDDEEEGEGDMHEIYSHEMVGEVCAAITCLGIIAKVCGVNFGERKFFQPSARLLVMRLGCLIPDIQKAAVAALQAIVLAVIPRPIQSLSQATTNSLKNLFQIFLRMMQTESEKEVVAVICDAITNVLMELGFVAIEGCYEELCATLLKLLKRETECFSMDGKTHVDHDLLMDSVCLTIDYVCKTVGPNFHTAFQQFFPVLVNILQKNNIDDKVMALATISEVCNSLKEKCAPFAQQSMQIALACVRLNNQTLKRNSFHCFGVLSTYAPAVVKPVLPQVAQLLQETLKNPKNFEPGVLDNACSAVAKILVAGLNGGPLLPLLLHNLPMKEDWVEAEFVYRFIVGLVNGRNKLVVQNVKPLTRIMQFVVNKQENELSVDVKKLIVDAMKGLISSSNK